MVALFSLIWAMALGGQAAAAELILYSSPNFQGKSLRVTGDVPNLREYRFNDEVSSLVVLSGEWALYEDSNYGGKAVRVPPGSYPEMGAVLMDNNELSSLRPLTPAAPPPPPPPKLPDLTISTDARSGFVGDSTQPDSVTFRGVIAFVTVANKGEGRAAASTLTIEPGPDELAPYRAAGANPCPRGEFLWPASAGGPAACVRLRTGDVLAKPAGAGLSCAIPALDPGDSARCAVSFSVPYTWLVPTVAEWTITATADSGRKIREADERNNAGDGPARIAPDALPAL
jgi:hypothetical protein